MTKQELESVAYWKSPRSAGHVRKNEDGFVAEITRFAFETTCERARVESLTLLNGVSYPTATVILHFFHTDRYPILDFRALESISVRQPDNYRFSFWWTYVEFCRDLAKEAEVYPDELCRCIVSGLVEQMKDDG